MTEVGQVERKVQDRLVQLFQDRLGYDYLGNWEKRPNNSNVEPAMLELWLRGHGHDDKVINAAIAEITQVKAIGGPRTLYEANRETYDLLRYGAKISSGIGVRPVTVHFIDWERPGKNHFAIAEEVTITGTNTKRPDIVIFINGIAVGVLELKRSFVNVAEGIRQHIGNQRPDFIQRFFSTVQLLISGNDTVGLRYAPIQTAEKYWLAWKEPSESGSSPLDIAVSQLCEKSRLLELIHDFVAFDNGVKKLPRHNQYFGVKAAQSRANEREGGIIWHTQGSGKSLLMVWLARWIVENISDSRVLVITDRIELDEQIESVFLGVGERIYRALSGADLVAALSAPGPTLICSLVHKFGSTATDDDAEGFVAELRRALPPAFSAKGDFFVFVDECHRTQSGVMHDAMKDLLPNATFIGFTGTPLLKKDKATTVETFGSFIHTYKFDEAVPDGVILDLRYEARDIDQNLTSPEKVDLWFEGKTRNLTDLARAQLKRRWGNMQQVLSSRSRASKIVNDIVFDMATKERLATGRGNALLVAGGIEQACKFYDLFAMTNLKGKVGLVTSYVPKAGAISKVDSGEGDNDELAKYETYRRMLAEHFDEPANSAVRRSSEYETQVKEAFVKRPGQMKLLIVVDKLLTGFDAPSATYLYIDKKMRDHGLFQALCRVNRLDGDDKEYGYIVDYEDLFNSIEAAVDDYTSDALSGYDEEDVDGLLEDRLTAAKDHLDESLEWVRAICEPVHPKTTPAYQHFFCSDPAGDAAQLKANERKRVELYKAVARLIRAYGAIATELVDAGYTVEESGSVKREVEHYEKVLREVRSGAGEDLDYKEYDADMRFLIDSYIEAHDSTVVTNFNDLGLLGLIASKGKDEAIRQLPSGIKDDPEAVAETIVNNIRKLITDEQPVNPIYYDRMSDLLDKLLEQRRESALEYKEYLERLAALASAVVQPEGTSEYPSSLNSPGRRALYDNLGFDEMLAIRIHDAVMATRKADWRGNRMKERELRNAIRRELEGSPAGAEVDPASVLELIRYNDEY